MWKSRLASRLFLLLLVLAPTQALEARLRPSLHVEIRERDARESRVKIQLPLSVAKIALGLAPKGVISEGRVSIEPLDREVSVSELRRLWKEVREVQEGELVTVDDGDDVVSVVRENRFLIVRAEDRHCGDVVHAEIPVTVIDALLSGDGDALDVRAALDELERERDAVIRIDGRRDEIRIWIE